MVLFGCLRMRRTFLVRVRLYSSSSVIVHGSERMRVQLNVTVEGSLLGILLLAQEVPV